MSSPVNSPMIIKMSAGNGYCYHNFDKETTQDGSSETPKSLRRNQQNHFQQYRGSRSQFGPYCWSPHVVSTVFPRSMSFPTSFHLRRPCGGRTNTNTGTVACWLLTFTLLFAATTTDYCNNCNNKYCFVVDASQAAATETLIGIVGDGFVLLGADSSVSSSISLTSSNVDKISVLVDPQIEMDVDDSVNGGNSSSSSSSSNNERVIRIDDDVYLVRTPLSLKRQLPIVAAAAGDPADTDRLVGSLQGEARKEEYSSGCWNADVQVYDVIRKRQQERTVIEQQQGGEAQMERDMDYNAFFDNLDDEEARAFQSFHSNEAGHNVHSIAQLTRRFIANALRSRTPLRVCLLIAGMKLVSISAATNSKNDGDGFSSSNQNKNIAPLAPHSIQVQKQVVQAHSHLSNEQSEPSTTLPTLNVSPESSNKLPNKTMVRYRPYLYWLDEYGSCQDVHYGAHGYGSNFCLSVLDRGYKPSMSKEDAIELMKDCFRQLRMRYVINSGPEPPCIKYVDENGVTEIFGITL